MYSDIEDSEGYSYLFYIDSLKLEAARIVSSLMGGLGTHPAFLQKQLPYFGSIRADTLLNNYEPLLLNWNSTSTTTIVSVEVNIGLNNGYLIAALMDKPFEPSSMSLPTHYLMKEGYFSVGTKFDQIRSVFGNQKVKATFGDLSANSKYTVFLFTTVDNSGVNSRTSRI